MDKNRAKPGIIDQIERKDTDLSPLVVRPITLNEKGTWDDLMSTHHYLGFNSKTLTGKTLKYAAVLNGQWVALLGWGAAALKNSNREKWIDWSLEQKKQH